MLKKYFMPKSLSWWSAVAEGVINLLRLGGLEIPAQVDGLIACAFGIGIRKAIHKD